MLKRKLLLILLISVASSFLLSLEARGQAPPQEPGYYRGSNYSETVNADGSVTWRSEPLWIYNGSHYVPYIYEDHYSSEGYHQVRAAQIGCRIYDYYAEFWDPNMSEIRLYDERWDVERWKVNKWDPIGAQAGSPTWSVIERSDRLEIIKAFHSWAGWLNLTYVFNGPLKHDVSFTSEMADPEQFRLIQAWAGIVGSKCKNETVAAEITEPIEFTGSLFEFLKADGNLSVKEDQFSAIDFLQQPVLIEPHAQGMKADFIFGTWSLSPSGILRIDPATETFYTQSCDGHIQYSDGVFAGVSDTKTYLVAGERWYTEISQYLWWRVFCRFDASSIPDGATITDADFYLYYYDEATEGSGDRGDCLVHHTEDMGATLDSSDWDLTVLHNHGAIIEGKETTYGWYSVDVTSSVSSSSTYITYRMKSTIEDSDTQALRWFFRASEYDSLDPYLTVDYVTNVAPTIGEFEASASPLYANEWLSLNCSIQDTDGILELKNCTVALNGSVTLAWDNATASFSINSDPSGYCTLNASGCIEEEKNSTAFTLSWRILLSWGYPQGSIDVLSSDTKAYDTEGASGSGSHADLFTFEPDIRVMSATPSKTQAEPGESLTVSGSIYYQGKAQAPSNSTGLTAKLETGGSLAGSTGSFSSGALTISFNAPSTEGQHNYTVYTTSNPTSVQNQTFSLQVTKVTGQGGFSGGYTPLQKVGAPGVFAPPEIVAPEAQYGTLALIGIFGGAIILYLARRRNLQGLLAASKKKRRKEPRIKRKASKEPRPKRWRKR
ncbi:MAG: hypothetical protein OEW69_09000 [Nitrospirota bacterium]|nr:hypothetical protein [Nitrospirota bacterium]